MSVRFKLADGTYVALGWDLRERGQPIVRVSFDYGGRPVMMLASPAQARGCLGGDEAGRPIGLCAHLNEDDARRVWDLAGASHAGTRRAYRNAPPGKPAPSAASGTTLRVVHS